MLERSGSTVGDREANLAADTTTAETVYREGMNERNRLATALETAVDGDDTFETRLDSARGRGSDHATLSTSLLALVKLGRELLLDKASLAGQQLAEGGLIEDELEKAKALGAKVKSSSANATGAHAGSRLAGRPRHPGRCVPRLLGADDEDLERGTRS